MFRTGSFSLLLVTAWNSLGIAVLQRRGQEWRELDDQGNAVLFQGREKAKEVLDLVGVALSGNDRHGMRKNIRFWVELRNQVAHRHLPSLDAIVIPYAQAALLNFENVLADEFGPEYLLGESLAVPLQLSGFRDPGVLASLKRLQASLPLDVQAFLANVTSASPELLADPSYMLRVAFLPAVPASGRSPDAIAYFVRPGEVPDELAEALDQYVVLPKVARTARPNLGAKHVVAAVEARIPFRFTVNMHAIATRRLKVRPAANAADQSATDARFCEYVPAVKLHLYNQAWVDHLVELLSTPEGFIQAVGTQPTPKDGVGETSSTESLA